MRQNNSIGLIAQKDTVVRIYVDTQADPSRPTITTISGLLKISPAGSDAWIPIQPLNGPIFPKRDAAIKRSNADDTLNFLIPGTSCEGEVDIRIQVFDATQANQPGYTRGLFQDMLEFTTIKPLNVWGVGIHYTGTGPNIPATGIPAPLQADLNSMLNFVRQTYPVGNVSITGFQVIDFGGDFTDSSGDGCGSGWEDLLSTLREMQRDHDDIYYGLVPAGVPWYHSGCGGGDGRAAASPVTVPGQIDFGPTAAEEIGHALERQHAPCGDPPNPDPDYPTYHALPSGSIGEVGINNLGQVQDPAWTYDFISYCVPKWVSPYTYEALHQKFPAVPLSAHIYSQKAQSMSVHRPLPSQHLFLNFRIYRGGRVEVFPSFHYLSSPAIKSGRWTPYPIELRDRHNKVMQAQRVWITDPSKDLDSAYKSFFKPIPFPEDTARVVFTCGSSESCEQKELLTVDVPSESPKVKIVSPTGVGELSGKVRVVWETEFSEKPLYYLLRYSNDGGQSWRTLAPHLKVTEYIVDLDRLPGGKRCQFQVLATEGIRTGMAVSQSFSVLYKRREATIIAPLSGTVVSSRQPIIFSGGAFSPDTGSAHPSELQWYDDEILLGKGPEIDVRALSPGVYTISLKVSDGLGGESVSTLQIVVNAPMRHTSLTHPNHTSRDHQAKYISAGLGGGSLNGIQR